MSWQKCPVCNGLGKTLNTQISSMCDKCNTCDGKKIINTLTGLPPAGNISLGKSEDDVDFNKVDKLDIGG